MKSGFEEAVRVRQRPGFIVEPASIAWNAVALELRGERRAIAAVPRSELRAFFADLDRGRLDDTIRDFLGSPPSGRVLRSARQASKPGLFDSLASPDAIVPSERVPGRGLLGGAGSGRPTDARRRKRHRPPRPRRLWLVAAGVTAAAVVGAGAVAMASRGSSTKVSTATPVTTTSSPTSTTTAPANFFGRYKITYTVTSAKVGPSYTGLDKPVVGSVYESGVTLNCQPDCEVGTPDPGIGFQFVSKMKFNGNRLEGTLDENFGDPACKATLARHFTTVMDLQRSGTGDISGFTGTISVVHPGGVEEVVNGKTCSTYDSTRTFTATLLGH